MQTCRVTRDVLIAVEKTEAVVRKVVICDPNAAYPAAVVSDVNLGIASFAGRNCIHAGGNGGCGRVCGVTRDIRSRPRYGVWSLSHNNPVDCTVGIAGDDDTIIVVARLLGRVTGQRIYTSTSGRECVKLVEDNLPAIERPTRVRACIPSRVIPITGTVLGIGRTCNALSEVIATVAVLINDEGLEEATLTVIADR